jgi:tetratricopeptide (TPR) repeat protein
MRLLFFILLIFSFDVQSKVPEPGYGLPELASETWIKELNSKKRAKVMTPSVARKMQKVLEALDEAGILEQEKALLKKEKKDKEAEAKDKEIAKAVANGQRELDDLKPRLASLKSYDRSMYYYYQSYYNLAYQDKIPEAIKNYINVVNEKDTAEKLRVEAYYVLAQLYLSESNYKSGVDYLLRWFKYAGEVKPDGYVLLGQAYYLLADKESTKSKALASKQKAYNNVLEAKKLADEKQIRFRENWYSLLLAAMSELDLKEEQVPLYEEILELYPKKKYFVNLAGLYNDLDRQRDYTALLKTAYTKQLLDKKGEFQSLAQMLNSSGNPYWAAEVILTGMTSVPGLKVVDQECMMSKVLDDDGNLKTDNKGIAIEELVCTDIFGPAFVKPGSRNALDAKATPVLIEDKQNLTILAGALRAAQERKAAIDVFEKLTKVTNDGEAFIAMGNLYYQEDEIEKAIEAINKGLKKGNLKNPGFAQLTLGQALFELQRFNEARDIFTKASASKKDSVKKSARAWLKYTDNEQERVKNLNIRRESIS